MLLLSLFDSRTAKKSRKLIRCDEAGFGFSVLSCAAAGEDDEAQTTQDWLLWGGGEAQWWCVCLAPLGFAPKRLKRKRY